MIPRTLTSLIEQKLFKGKAIILFGARQVGKTTLIETILSQRSEKVIYFNGDDFDTRQIFAEANVKKLQQNIGNAKIVFIDEAQRIPDIGLIIKIFVDRIKGVQVIASGSSSFQLHQQVGEPLTGRAFTFTLFGLSFAELTNENGLQDEKRMLENRLIYGSYPEVVTSFGEERDVLKLLTGSYLFKDIDNMSTIQRPELLDKVTRAIALQIGSEVSTSELAQLAGADRGTIEKYLYILEQAFVIFKLNSLSKNVRNEIKKGKKYYFFDNGIRNAILGNFTSLSSRNDAGALWENYCIAERVKRNVYEGTYKASYFWRTAQQQEIDYIEEENGIVSAYEIKFNPKSRIKQPQTFLQAYNCKHVKLVSQENLQDFLI